MFHRNEPPYHAYEIAACLRHRFGRLHGSELTEDKVMKAKNGHAVFRRQIELAGGGSLLPPLRPFIDNRRPRLVASDLLMFAAG